MDPSKEETLIYDQNDLKHTIFLDILSILEINKIKSMTCQKKLVSVLSVKLM